MEVKTQQPAANLVHLIGRQRDISVTSPFFGGGRTARSAQPLHDCFVRPLLGLLREQLQDGKWNSVSARDSQEMH